MGAHRNAQPAVSFHGESIVEHLAGIEAVARKILREKHENLALEMTRTALGLADDLANGIITKRIIELARIGEHLFGD